MKFLIRWAMRLFILGVVLVVALLLLKDTLLKAFAEYAIRSETGLAAKIGRLELGLSSPRLTIENLRVDNTAEFGGSPLIDIPELHVEWDLAALWSRNPHLKLLRLHLRELNIVESKDGRTNIAILQQRAQARDGPGPGSVPVAVGWRFQSIDVLNLTVDKVKYTSLRKPSNKMELDVGLKNEVLTNVKSMDDLSGLLLKVMLRKGISLWTGGSKSITSLLLEGPQAPPISAPPRPRASNPATPGKAGGTNAPVRR